MQSFQQTVWDYYAAHARHMPWRDNPTPYNVLVSEIMLQQTQVPRVVPKFQAFVGRFPDVATLAQAELGDVLALWSGLGYNRRAKFLWQAAQHVQALGAMPNALADLTKLPGIGPNTAGAIMAYAYNKPAVFIETNIRTVFIHHFFADSGSAVTDAQIKQLVAKSLPKTNIRQWYWALMDYGTHLKSVHGAQLHRVRGYKKQSRFTGSLRQIRGKVLRVLLSGRHTRQQLEHVIQDERLGAVLQALEQENLIRRTPRGYTI